MFTYLGHKSVKIKPLEEDAAFARGAEILGESFLFLVAGFVVVYDYSDSKTKSAQKEREKKQELETILSSLEKRIELLEEQTTKIKYEQEIQKELIIPVFEALGKGIETDRIDTRDERGRGKGWKKFWESLSGRSL